MLCACGVQLPLCARQSHPGPAGVSCAGRALGGVARGGAIVRYGSTLTPTSKMLSPQNTAPWAGMPPEYPEMMPPQGRAIPQARMGI